MASTDLYDRFAGTAGTVLAGGHTSDSGHTWTAIGGDVGLELSGLGNGRVYAATANGGFGPTSSWTPPGADYRSLVRLSVLSTPTTGDVIGLAHRFAPTTGSNFNCYYWVYTHGTGFAIFGSKDGTFAQIGSNFSATIADGNLVDFTSSGTTTVTLTLALNGATILTETDSSSPITATGAVALLNIPAGGGNTQTTTTGIQHDTIWVGSTAGPSSSISPSSPSVALSGTQAFTSSQSAGLSGVSPAIVYTWTATHGTFTSGTGVAGATYTAPASGTSDTVTATNVDLSTLGATDAVTLTSSVTDYYVAASGSDSNPGSSGSPFLTIAHAISASSAGNTIHLNGGDTFAEAVGLTSGRTITSYGTGRATIAPASVDPTAGVPVTATNCDGVNLTNLIHKAASTLVGAVVYLDNTDGTRRTTNGVSVVGCDLSGAMNGIVASSASGGGLNGVTISGNTIHDLLNFGVYTTRAGGTSGNCYSNVQIHDNTIYNITGNSTMQGSGIALGNCDSTTGTNAAQCVIQRNHIYNCGQDAGASAGPAGSFPINSDGVLTQFNVVHDISSGTSNVDGVAYDHDIGTSNCITQYNYGYNCDGAGFLLDGSGSGHVVRFNLFANVGNRAAGGAVRLNAPGGLQFYNNTVVGGVDNGLLIDSGHSVGKKIYNNIFDCPSGSTTVNIAGTPDVSMVLEGNAYQSGSGGFKAIVNGTTYTSLSAFTTGTGLEATGHSKLTTAPFTNATPQDLTPGAIDLMTAFVLSPTATPALKAQGLNLQSLFSIDPATVDFLGNTLGSPYSIGAIDATTGSGARSPTADEIASAVWAAATGTALASVLSGSSGITLAGIAATGSETFGVVSGIPGLIPINFTDGLFSGPGVFSTPALVHAPSGGSGGSDPWATNIIAGDYAANTAGALLLNRPYLARSGSTTTFAMDADDALVAQDNVGLQLLFPSRSGSNQAGAGFTALITASNISTGVQTFSPPCPTAVDSTFYYTTFVPILNAHLAGESATSVTGVVVSSTTTSVTISATGSTVFNAAQNAYAGVVPRYLTFTSGANQGPASIVSSSSVANGHLTVGFASTVGIVAATVGDEVEID